jgi:polysaccharide biosynthesis protein PelA
VQSAKPLTYACYYGPARLPQLACYAQIIVQPAYYTAGQVAYLRSRGVCAIAYLSIGYEPAPEAVRDWYVFSPYTGLPARDPRWDVFVVDCRSPTWQEYVLRERIPEILNRGFQGLFLDNLDVQESYPDTRSGVIDLVRRIRRAHPDLTLIVNRGFSVLDALVSTVDGVLFEAFTTYHDTERYAAWEGAELAWTEMQAARLRQLNPEWPILALDYALPHEQALRHLAEARARAHGFSSFVSNRALDWLPDSMSSANHLHG